MADSAELTLFYDYGTCALNIFTRFRLTKKPTACNYWELSIVLASRASGQFLVPELSL